jgi:hypothetical protein
MIAGHEPRLATPVKDEPEYAGARAASGSSSSAEHENPTRLPRLGMFSVTTPERTLEDAYLSSMGV